MAYDAKIPYKLVVTAILLLVYFFDDGEAMDGCDSLFDFKCGDQCLYYNGGICNCISNGTNTTITYDMDKWCCSNECEVVEKDGDGDNIVVTCKGTALNLTQQCNKQSPSCNFYPKDNWRNYRSPRSHLDVCKDNSSCVNEEQLCKGTPLCDNLMDLKWCKNATKWSLPDADWNPRFSFSMCNLQNNANDTSPNGQWIKSVKKSDGRIFHCLNRGDENPFEEKGKKNATIDWLTLVNEPCEKNRRRCLGGRPDHCVNAGGWEYPDTEYGCLDYSGVVADIKTDNSNKSSCPDIYSYAGGNLKKNVTWTWFMCHRNGKCVHEIQRCDLRPNPACLFENEKGERRAEDEEGCLEEYKKKGLVARSANFKCQSRSNNKNSSAVLSTIFNQTYYDATRDWNGSFVPNVVVIGFGTIVDILSTRCNGVPECWKNLDEAWCGFNTYINATSSGTTTDVEVEAKGAAGGKDEK